MAAPDRSDATPASRRARLSGRAGDHRHLLAGSAALVIGAAVQALSGALFWLAAARIDTTDDVGQATALFTSILFIAYLSGLGLQVSLARFAPDRSEESHGVFTWGVVASVVSAAVVAAGYLVVVDTQATRTLTDWHPIAGPALFLAGSAGSTLTQIVDVRWMTVRRWSLILWRISIVGIVRLALLVTPSNGADAVHLFAVAIAPLILTGVAGVAWMPRITGGRHRLFPLPTRRRAAIRYSAVNYLSTLAYQAPQFVLPVIVLLSVDPDQNASFYVAWGITAVGLYVPMAIGQALLAEGGKDGRDLRGQVRLILGITTALMAVAATMTAVGHDLVTTVYGDDYADAARVLTPLILACIPWAITSVYLTEARVLHRNIDTVVITVTLTTAILIPALALVPDEGLDGATTAFVFGNVVAAVVATSCHVWHRTRRTVPVPDTTTVDDFVLHP